MVPSGFSTVDYKSIVPTPIKTDAQKNLTLSIEIPQTHLN
jgi:hypothetical protein